MRIQRDFAIGGPDSNYIFSYFDETLKEVNYNYIMKSEKWFYLRDETNNNEKIINLSNSRKKSIDLTKISEKKYDEISNKVIVIYNNNYKDIGLINHCFRNNINLKNLKKFDYEYTKSSYKIDLEDGYYLANCILTKYHSFHNSIYSLNLIKVLNNKVYKFNYKFDYVETWVDLELYNEIEINYDGNIIKEINNVSKIDDIPSPKENN